MSQQESNTEDIAPIKPEPEFPDITQFYTFSQQKAAMLRAICKCLGNVSRATILAGIARKTHYNWLESDPAYAEAFAEIGEARVDIAQEMLVKGILEGVPSLIKFELMNKGQARGYHPDGWHVAQANQGKDGVEVLAAPSVIFEAPDEEDEILPDL